MSVSGLRRKTLGVGTRDVDDADMTKELGPEDDATADVGETWPIEACPRCDGREFELDLRHDTTVFRCRECNACWKYELGFVWAME